MTVRVSGNGSVYFVPEDSRAYPPFLASGEGACATHPTPDDFTDESTRRASMQARWRAKAVCALCPFAAECHEWALATNQQGVWGGTTTAERERERTRRQGSVVPHAA